MVFLLDIKIYNIFVSICKYLFLTYILTLNKHFPHSRTNNDTDIKLFLEPKLFCVHAFPAAWSIRLTFSLIVTFSLTKNKNRTKSLTQPSYYCFE